MADDNAGYSDAFWRDAERKLPEPTPPTETQDDVCNSCGQKIERHWKLPWVHSEPYDAEMLIAKGCLGKAAPTERVETRPMTITRRTFSDPDEVAALLGEIHKDVQDQIHDQWDWMNASFYTECLRCMVHRAREVAAPTERVETSREDIERGRDLCELEFWLKTSSAIQRERLMELIRKPLLPDMAAIRVAMEELIELRKLAAVAPSPAGESQEEILIVCPSCKETYERCTDNEYCGLLGKWPNAVAQHKRLDKTLRAQRMLDNAAPELLKACKAVVEICEDGDTGADFGRVVAAMHLAAEAIKLAEATNV